MYFRYFVTISLWKRASLPFEQTWIPITQECLVTSFVEIGPVVLEIFFNLSMNYFAFSLSSPLGKEHNPSFLLIWMFIAQESLIPNFGWNWPCGSWEKDENVKTLQTDGQTTDNPWSEKLTQDFSSGKLNMLAIWPCTSCSIISGTIQFYITRIRGGSIKTTNLCNPTWRATRACRPLSGQM